MMRYLPFIVGSIILYTLFFYKNQTAQKPILDPVAEKVIPLDFEKLAQVETQNKISIQTTALTSGKTETSSQENFRNFDTPAELNNSNELTATQTTIAPVSVKQQLNHNPQEAKEKLEERLLEMPPKANIAENVLQSNKLVPQQSITQNESIYTSPTTQQNKLAKLTMPATGQSTQSALSPDPTLNKLKQFQTSITATPASETASLKAELYKESYYLTMQTPAPKASSKMQQSKVIPTKKKRIAIKKETLASEQTTQIVASQTKTLSSTEEIQPNSAISELLKHTQSTQPVQQNEKLLQSKKPKRVFKKQVNPLTISNQQQLQQAIAVSGNKPLYPEQAKIDKQQGAVTVKFIVNMKGKTKQPQIVTSSGYPVLDNAILDFIEEERFMPALEGRDKISSEQQFSFEFSQ